MAMFLQLDIVDFPAYDPKDEINILGYMPFKKLFVVERIIDSTILYTYQSEMVSNSGIPSLIEWTI